MEFVYSYVKKNLSAAVMKGNVAATLILSLIGSLIFYFSDQAKATKRSGSKLDSPEMSDSTGLSESFAGIGESTARLLTIDGCRKVRLRHKPVTSFFML